MPSASVTAPTRSFSQSASVFGLVSTTRFLLITGPTESNTKSDAGSIMSRISSLTDTTGWRAPQRPGRAGAGAGAFDEQPPVHTPSAIDIDKFLSNFTKLGP